MHEQDSADGAPAGAPDEAACRRRERLEDAGIAAVGGRSVLSNCPTITQLARALARGPYGRSVRALMDTCTHDEHLVLVAPATVALCVRDAGLAERSTPLRLMLLGASGLDWIDDGQWYRLLQPLLGGSWGVEATAYVGDRAALRQSTVPAALEHSLGIRTRVEDGYGPTEALAAQFDLAVTFRPGFAHGEVGAGEPPVRALVRAGLPVYACDFGPLLQTLDRAFAASYGVSSRSVACPNPYRLVSRRRGENWAGTITRFVDVDAATTAPDAERLAVLRLAAEMVLDSCVAGRAEPPYPPGSVVAARGVRGRAVHVFDGLLVDESHGLYEVPSRGGRARRVGSLSGLYAEIASDFDASWSELDRFLWGATLKAGWRARSTAGAA
jgi:hypothetical protein